MQKFNCLRCGDCCTNLILETQFEVYTGLALFPEEKKLFSKKLVSPYRASGEYPKNKNFSVFMFQLNVESCPHFKKKNSEALCNIYEKRPWTCKSYPFEIGEIDEYGQLTYFSKQRCKATQKKKKLEQKIRMNRSMAPVEISSAYQIFIKISPMYMRGTKWILDLKSGEWCLQTYKPISF